MNALKRLRQGKPVFGIFQTFPDAATTELAIWCGYDFVILDCEHGVVDESAQMGILRTLAGSDTFSLVRVRARDEPAVSRYLDFGADGVMVPDVRTPAQAQRIVSAAIGRWTTGLRYDRYGLEPRNPSDRPLVIVLIESQEGVGNIDAILETDGIDGVIVGSGDLSTALGMPGDFAASAYLSAIDKVEQSARDRGKILGAKPYGEFSIAKLVQRGHRLIVIGRDVAFLRNSLVGALAAAKEEANKS